MIAIIDYGMGNLGAIANMLKKLGRKAVVTRDPNVINEANKLILPGVGAFDSGMANLESRGLVDVLNAAVIHRRKPILGICLGMQLFTDSSEEGARKGLGWIKGKTVRFTPQFTGPALKVPHMGWNTIRVIREHALFREQSRREMRFYFVHSYHVVLRNDTDVLTMTRYGNQFVSSLQCDNIVGVQFHPEKSHRFGMSLLNAYALDFP